MKELIQKIVEENGYEIVELTNRYITYTDSFGINFMSIQSFINIHLEEEKEKYRDGNNKRI